MLIRHGLVLCERQGVYEFSPLDLRVEDGYITGCGSGLTARTGEECFSAAGMLLTPGLINSHVHSYTNLPKGTSLGEPLELWGLGTVAIGAGMTPEEMALSARLGIAEMLRCGVTSCIDHIPHPVAVYPAAKEYRDAGFRAVIAPMLHDRSDHLVLKGIAEELPTGLLQELKNATGMEISERVAQYEQWIRDLHRPTERLSMLVGVNAPQRCTEELLSAAGDLARKHKLGIHMHLRESRWQADSDLNEGIDSIEKLARAELLGNRTSLAHCVHLTQEHVEQLADTGVMIVHNPTSNLFLGSGVMPLGRYRANGIRVAFGSDGCNCATSHNILELARTAMLLERSYQANPESWQPLSCWYDGMTRLGWNAMGFSAPAGELTEGAPADIVFCNAVTPALLPAVDLPRQFLINQGAPDVVHVMIDGSFVLRDRKILTFDEAALYAELAERSPYLRERFNAALASTETLRSPYERALRKRMK